MFMKGRLRRSSARSARHRLPSLKSRSAASAPGRQSMMIEEFGVVDPTKVTRSALQNASSVAEMVLTTESLVADIPEKEPAMPAADPSMGGMGQQTHRGIAVFVPAGIALACCNRYSLGGGCGCVAFRSRRTHHRTDRPRVAAGPPGLLFSAT